jgi:hypothetical protein
MASHGFSEKQLRDRGFVRGSDGAWHKGAVDLQAGSPRPQSQIMERGAGLPSSQAPSDEGRGQGSDGQSFPRFQVVIASYRANFIDCSNAVEKWIEDALVKAKVIPDDAPRYCPAPRFIQIKSKEPRTEVYVFQI